MYIDISKPCKILIIVIESKFLSRLSEQQSKRRDGLMNKNKNTSEHDLYLYIIENTEEEEEKKQIHFFLLLVDGNNCRTDFYTQLMTKKNEYMRLFF